MVERAATDLAIFTDRYWVTDVTNQAQGQELYELWVRRLRLRELYGQVRDEVEYVNGVLAARAQASVSERADKLGAVGFPLLLGSALFGLWGSNWMGSWCQSKNLIVGSGVVFFLVGALVWAGYLRERRR